MKFKIKKTLGAVKDAVQILSKDTWINIGIIIVIVAFLIVVIMGSIESAQREADAKAKAKAMDSAIYSVYRNTLEHHTCPHCHPERSKK